MVWNINFIFHILGISSSQLTNIIFQRGSAQPPISIHIMILCVFSDRVSLSPLVKNQHSSYGQKGYRVDPIPRQTQTDPNHIKLVMYSILSQVNPSKSSYFSQIHIYIIYIFICTYTYLNYISVCTYHHDLHAETRKTGHLRSP